MANDQPTAEVSREAEKFSPLLAKLGVGHKPIWLQGQKSRGGKPLRNGLSLAWSSASPRGVLPLVE